MLLTCLKFLNWNDKEPQLDSNIVDIMNATVMIIKCFLIMLIVFNIGFVKIGENLSIVNKYYFGKNQYYGSILFLDIRLQ